MVVVRYYDTLAGESMGHYDFNIHIKIIATTTLTLSDQVYGNLQKCSQNIFPLSYGGLDTSRTPNKGGDMIGYGIFFVDDYNLIVSGKSQNLTHDDSTTNDGFVMRITPLGFINWISYLSTMQS